MSALPAPRHTHPGSLLENRPQRNIHGLRLGTRAGETRTPRPVATQRQPSPGLAPGTVEVTRAGRHRLAATGEAGPLRKPPSFRPSPRPPYTSECSRGQPVGLGLRRAWGRPWTCSPRSGCGSGLPGEGCSFLLVFPGATQPHAKVANSAPAGLREIPEPPSTPTSGEGARWWESPGPDGRAQLPEHTPHGGRRARNESDTGTPGRVTLCLQAPAAPEAPPPGPAALRVCHHASVPGRTMSPVPTARRGSPAGSRHPHYQGSSPGPLTCLHVPS